MSDKLDNIQFEIIESIDPNKEYNFLVSDIEVQEKTKDDENFTYLVISLTESETKEQYKNLLSANIDIKKKKINTKSSLYKILKAFNTIDQDSKKIDINKITTIIGKHIKAFVIEENGFSKIKTDTIKIIEE